MKSPRSPGFSLIELLVTVAIVSVLATLAVTAMQGISRRRDVQVCQNNLRQVYVLLQAYIADHAGRFPPAISDSPGDITLHWRRAILPYMGKRPGGSGVTADVFDSGLVCPAMARDPRAEPAFKRLCNFGVNANVGDPAAPLERGIPLASIRKPSRFFLATESSFGGSAIPREAIRPKDFNTYSNQWNYHDQRFQNVLFADGHIEFFENARRLIMAPYAVGKAEDLWTP